MPAVKGMEHSRSVEETQRRINVWRECNLNTSAAARALGIHRSSMQETVRKAQGMGLVEATELNSENAPRAEDYLAARERKFAAYQRKKKKGDWRKPVLTNLPERPFRLKVFGDPHLDDDGCDFELFERHWLEMDSATGVYGVCVGDWFNNWLRALSHLWKEASTPPSDAWLLLEHLMHERGDALIAACSGNHDDWSHGPADPVDMLMKQHGVLYRKGAIRVMFQCGSYDPFFVAMRHKWRGSSMYSAAHWGVRANREGWRDSILVGGHIHQDEPRLVSHVDGFKSHVCQVSAFKRYDEHVDVQGYNGPRISPVWDLVIDPSRPDTDPDKVKTFWCSDAARKYLAAIQ